MTKFFIYLEKVLTNVKFFEYADIANIKNPDSDLSEEERKNARFENGDIFVEENNQKIIFNFKIDHLIYELVFIKSLDGNSKTSRKIMNNLEIDPKTKNRYGIDFYVKGHGYETAKLTSAQSEKLFDYLKTCATNKRVIHKKFYFDGVPTTKENTTFNQIEKFIKEIPKEIEEIKNNNNQKNIDVFCNSFEFKLKKTITTISLNAKTLEEIKRKINRICQKINKNNIKKAIKIFFFILRDEYNININTRERFFMKMLKKEGINPVDGKKYTRTIFFEL